MAVEFTAPLLVRAGAGEVIPAGGVDHLFPLTGPQAGGRLALERFTLAAGEPGARPHVHRGHDEIFVVLAGELTFHTGRDEVAAGPGDVLAALRGSAHGFRNASAAEAQALCFYTPAGYENFFRDLHAAVAEDAGFDAEQMARLRVKYDSYTL